MKRPTPQEVSLWPSQFDQADWIREKATIRELLEYISLVYSPSLLSQAEAVLRAKIAAQAHKSHCMLVLTFWISLGVFITSMVILAVAWMSWWNPKTLPIPNDRPALSETNSGSIPITAQ